MFLPAFGTNGQSPVPLTKRKGLARTRFEFRWRAAPTPERKPPRTIAKRFHLRLARGRHLWTPQQTQNAWELFRSRQMAVAVALQLPRQMGSSHLNIAYMYMTASYSKLTHLRKKCHKMHQNIFGRQEKNGADPIHAEMNRAGPG